MKKIFSTLFIAAAFSCAAFAQDLKMPAPSPTATIKQDFSTSGIEITYSRPSLRGRKIFGEVVPFGKVWRTGANSATKIVLGEDLLFKGNPVKAGTYSLYTVPGATEWKVIINKSIGNWGTNGFDEKDDVATFTVPVQKTAETVQSFTIAVDNITINSCDIVLAWENTKVVIPVKADNDHRITEYLETAINKPRLPYQQAANYYLETGSNLDKAAVYADKAIEANDGAFYLYWLKARILARQGKKAEAIAAAKMSADKAASTPYAEEYKDNYERLQAELK